MNSDIFISGLGSIGLSVTYAKSDGPVIDNVTYSNGYFPLKTFTQDKNGQDISGTLSYFKFNPGKLLNPYLFVFYLWQKQYQQNGSVLTPIELSAISPQIGVKMTFNKEHSLNLSIQTMINSSQQSDTSKSISSRFNVDLKDDNKICNNLYYNFSTKWIMIYANSHYSSINPVTNFTLYQYLGKESKWQINYGVKNLFNVNDKTY